MNKYDDVLLTMKLVKRDYKNDEYAQDYLDKVVDLLRQAEKQEKLLELYRELNNKILYTYDIFERMTNKEWKKFVDIQQQIKELENEDII